MNLKRFITNNKGQMGQLGSLAVGIAVLAITLVVTFLVISEGRSQAEGIEDLDFSNQTECYMSATCNATDTLTNAAADVPGWVPLIVIAVIGAVLLGLVNLFRSK